MKASSLNWRDVEKYYAGTFIMVPEVSEQSFFRVTKVSPDGMVVTDWQNLSEEGFISFTGGYQYEIKNPLFGKNQWVLNSKGGAAFVTRRPARQWKKGISEQNTLIYSINSKGVINPVSFNMVHLSEFFSKKTSSNTVEIHDGVWLYHKPSSNLMYEDHFVGKLSNLGGKCYLPTEFQGLDLPFPAKEVVFL
jgi:hypothetical protein